MTTPPLLAALAELGRDFRDPGAWWQAGVLAASLGAAWWLARALRAYLATRWKARADSMALAPQLRFVGGGVGRLMFPLVALLFVLIGRAVLGHFHHVDLLHIAVPLLFAFAAVRGAVYLLRHVFVQGGVLATSERWISILVWLGVALHFTGLLPPVVGAFEDITFSIGKQKISMWLVAQALFSIALTMLVSMWLSSVIEGRLMAAATLDMSLRVVAGRFIKAFLVFVAVLMSLALVGIDLTVLSIFGGALGVGLGLGLQRIASNYFAGFIILLDRSIRIGDMITVDKYSGSVTQINTRFTVLKSLDGTEAIVPNEMLVNSPVANLSYTTRENRLALQVPVAYDSDLDLVRTILIAAATAHPRVLAEPAPAVFLRQFGDNGLELELGFWISDPEQGSLNVRSEINFAIWDQFRAGGVQIPYPRREVRVIDPALP